MAKPSVVGAAHGRHVYIASGENVPDALAGAPECALGGETMAHRLLKLELVTAVREAGWDAQLEVSGDGWRADVMAIRPDGSDRMAWEAQLAQATREELEARTARFSASGVRVCWVTDAIRPFAGHVPAVRIERTAREPGGPDWLAGLASARPSLPCPGHGQWDRPPVRISLTTFVGAALAGTITPYTPTLPGPAAAGRHAGPLIWTSRRHREAEATQVDATSARAHQARTAALQRDQLTRAREDATSKEQAIDDMLILAIQRYHSHAGIHDAFVEERQPFWGMGRPVIVRNRVTHLLAPAASHIHGSVRRRLGKVIVVAASHEARDDLVHRCISSQQFLVVDAVGRPVHPA